MLKRKLYWVGILSVTLMHVTIAEVWQNNGQAKRFGSAGEPTQGNSQIMDALQGMQTKHAAGVTYVPSSVGGDCAHCSAGNSQVAMNDVAKKLPIGVNLAATRSSFVYGNGMNAVANFGAIPGYVANQQSQVLAQANADMAAQTEAYKTAGQLLNPGFQFWQQPTQGYKQNFFPVSFYNGKTTEKIGSYPYFGFY